MTSPGQEGRSQDAGSPDVPDRTVVLLARIVPVAFGVAVGGVAALGLLVATVVLVVKGGEVVGPHLGLLGQYLPGYEVSWSGALVGSAYALVFGFGAGWTFAVVRNAAVHAYMRFVYTRAEHHAASDILDRLS